MSNNQIYFPFLKVSTFILVLLVFGIGLVKLFQIHESGNIVFSEFSALSFFSLGIFLIVCFFGLYSSKLYFTFLIFVLLAFPAPINDFFPGTYLGNPMEKNASVFPFFTHIDLFLFLGIFRGLFLCKQFSFKSSKLFTFVIFCLSISILANFFKPATSHEVLLLIQGMFQFRYLLELYILLSLFDIRSFKNNIIFGFILSIVFLFIESIAFTFKTHSVALTSGSLANNTYASIVASILLYFYLINKKYPHSGIIKLNLKFVMFISILIIIFSGARMAILAFLVTYLIVSFIMSQKKLNWKSLFKWVGIIIVFLFVVNLAASYLPKRYNPHTITDKISIHNPSMNLKEFIRIERSWETNSLITRLELYSTSLNMLRDNLLTGIGVGRWNIQKKHYGFNEFLLIDSHNGYLSILSQYGLLGIPLILFIYFSPVYMLFVNLKLKKENNLLIYLGVINLYISFADLSNSGVFKHQIFALLAFNAIVLLKLHQQSSISTVNPPNPL